MAKRNALGRGLDSLISFGEIRTEGSSAINEIPIDSIAANPEQPRTNFDPVALEELAASIRELGVIQPLTLRGMGNDSYQIIAGERRWRAARMAGLTSVPAYVRSAADAEVTQMALIENIQREDLNAIEVALAFRKLIDTYHLTQDGLSERLGKNRATIANHLRLLRLPSAIQLGLRDRKLDMGHARALLAVDDPKAQLKLYGRIIREGLSVRAVEQLAKKQDRPQDAESRQKQQDDGTYDAFVSQLSDIFPTPVKFSRNAAGKGSITLKFSSDDELRQLVKILEGISR